MLSMIDTILNFLIVSQHVKMVWVPYNIHLESMDLDWLDYRTEYNLI